MNYPDCPNNKPEKCRFQDEAGTCTTMHSPIIRDREGRAIGGGMNMSGVGISCHACGNRWGSRASELEDAQGKPRQWTMVEPLIAKQTFLVNPMPGSSGKIIQTKGEIPIWNK